MKKKMLQIFCLSFAFFLSISIYAQNESETVKVLKNDKTQVKDVLPHPPAPNSQLATVKDVDELPRFPGCENQGMNESQLKDCAFNKQLQYMYKNLNYPAEARENGIEGVVLVQFVIGVDGVIDNIKLVKDIGGGCGDSTLDVLMKMQKEITWIPGIKDGKKVRVQHTIPVKFKL